MNKYFDNPLFILEMANNHMGDLDFGLEIIKEFGKIRSIYNYQFGIKFQFRNLKTFIHPDFQNRMDLKYVKRFKETSLSLDAFKTLKEESDKQEFISICTAFDEESVDKIEELNFEIIKIASCSFTDWPLLERIVKTDKPIIASTAGATLEEIDSVVSFLQHRNKYFAIMHCVGEYPTKFDNLQLSQIDLLKNRYPRVPIGFSTHEHPRELDSIKIAVAKGAIIFEKHVTLDSDKFKKNDYSATPEQVNYWVDSAWNAYTRIGSNTRIISPKEQSDLCQFKRGVFAKNKIQKGEKIDLNNIFFAFPNIPEQLLANDISKYSEYIAKEDINEFKPILYENINICNKREKIWESVQEVKQIIKKSNIKIPGLAELEISHHYGIEKFKEYGCTIIGIINREYCKKLIIVLAGQSHPEQYHKIKEETFVVLYGDVDLTLNGNISKLSEGDVVTINRGDKHIFASTNGAIIEEISTTHFKNDSYYTDPSIENNRNRKTILTYWIN